MKTPPNLLQDFARSLELEFVGSTTELTSFPSGGAMLDVRCGGRLFVMSHTPQQGYAVDEVRADDGWVAGYQFVSPDFEPAAEKLRSLVGSHSTNKNGDASVALNLVVIYTANLEAAAQFYSTMGLDLTLEKHGRGPEHFSAELAGTVVELYPCTAGKPCGGSRLGFRVSAIEPIVEALRRQSAKVLTEPHDSPWGRRAVVEDFDGNRIELTQADDSHA